MHHLPEFSALVTLVSTVVQSGLVPEQRGAGLTRVFAAAAAAAVVALLGASAWTVLHAPGTDRFARCRESQIAGGAGSIGGPFTLVNQDGQTVTESDVIVTPVLIYFGYTSCPDVCPPDNARNAEATDILESKGIKVTPVFISVDPARDTPEAVRNYVAGFHPRMIGLTGTEDQIRSAVRAFGAYFALQPGDDEFYFVNHSTFTYLVLPETGFAEFFRRDVPPEEMAERVSCFLSG